MGLVKWIAIIAVLIILFSFFVPVFHATSDSGRFFGATYQVDADESLTFLIAHCGSYINAHSTTTLGDIVITHQISHGYNFACNFSTSNGNSSVLIHDNSALLFLRS
jgi:hypothetical protein